ncbi:DUF3109 domain-containing protein [Putridiphycobacter roseus]|uniref:DUF3109 domain-containing protein n=1 Tax=Putridiphycobacter roseus TaxID=2219161 RepID=A0A2W1NL41_9FLAO|nr:DUF3109 family protein [Putridiphycobacter roseus]PZE16382.1 DUF3109 domain-containing protein [Putridiphycobacter roseus]
MIEIEDKLVSQELFEKHFVCNLSACKGACCVEGDDGAPLTMDEVELIEEHLEDIKPYMTESGIDMVDRKGVFYMDRDNEPVTSLVKGKDCVFVTLDEKGITKCGIEQAYREEKIPFNKPISCHLYPIRVRKYAKFESLNYDRWPICKPACQLGEELKVPVFKFLKEPLIRMYGADFYEEMEKVNQELTNFNNAE